MTASNFPEGQVRAQRSQASNGIRRRKAVTDAATPKAAQHQHRPIVDYINQQLLPGCIKRAQYSAKFLDETTLVSLTRKWNGVDRHLEVRQFSSTTNLIFD